MKTESQADRAVRLINQLTHTKGPSAGQTFKLRPWQEQGIIRKLFKTRKDGKRQYRTCLLMLPRKNGKALALDTPIPTPYGWVPMGEIQPGDAVFDERGVTCSVVAVGPIEHDRPCHKITFGDGTQIIADAEHEWVADHRDWSAGPRVVTTVGLKPSCRMPVAGRLDLPPVDLPIPPYTLGAWLGDGRCAGASLSSEDEEVYAAIAAEGVPVKRSRWEARLGGDRSKCGTSIQAKLRSLGLLEGKRIPSQYQRAGTAQRAALLRGLMDTDGFCSMAGQCEITTIYPQLALDMLELIRGLGLKASCTVGRAMLNGRDCGAKYRLQFWAFAGDSVFTIGRKTERQKAKPIRPTRSTRHYVQSVEAVDSQPVRCIQVDSPSRLYLAGDSMIPTHNSEICAALAIYFLLFDGEIGAEVYSAAADKEQAALVFNVAAQMIRNDPELLAQCEIIDSQKRIVHRKSGSFYRAISAEAYSKHGFNASVVIYDELHAAPDRELWDVLATSQGARAQPMMIAITTAGYDRTSILWELYAHAKRVAQTPSLDPVFLPILYEAPMDADWTDEKVWAKCNPALGDFRSLEEMRVTFKRAQLIPAQENTFRRLYLNQWTQAHSAFFDRGKWDACQTFKDSELLGCPCYGGLDLGQTDDFSAWVRIWLLPDARVAVKCRFWLPRSALLKYPERPYAQWQRAGLLEVTDGDTTDLDLVEQAVRDDCERDGIVEVAYDKRFAQQLALHLQGAGIIMVDCPQGFALNEAIRAVSADVTTGELCHNGHAILGWMSDNSVVVTGRQGELRLDKVRSKEKIDGIVALVMAKSRAIVAQPVPPGLQVFFLGGRA